jgi:hypothetical protein
MGSGFTRRRFLKALSAGALLALTSTGGCDLLGRARAGRILARPKACLPARSEGLAPAGRLARAEKPGNSAAPLNRLPFTGERS